MGKNKGKKMSMAEFLGDDAGYSNDAMALPSAPKERA